MDTNEKLDHELKLSIDNGNITKILELIEQGADPNVISYFEQSTVLELIMPLGRFDTLDFLIKKGANIHGEINNLSALTLAVFHHNKKLIDYFLDLGCDINSRNGDSYPLEVACNHIDYRVGIEIIKHLIANGAHIYDENDELFKELNEYETYTGFDIEEYYKNSTFAQNLKPAKR
jgi:ankyrin repeat protein